MTRVDIIRDMYLDSDFVNWTAVGDSTPLPFSVGVHHGSILSPFLFSLVIDVLSDSIRDPNNQPSWSLIYADDIVLANSDKEALVRRMNTWNNTSMLFDKDSAKEYSLCALLLHL